MTTNDPIGNLLELYLEGDDLKSKILDFHNKHLEDMRFYPASVKKHHCYSGGLYDHILEVMNNCLTLLPLVVKDVVEFNSIDTIVASYFHDADKLFRYELDAESPTEAQLKYAKDLGADINTEFESKTSMSFKIDAAKENKKYTEYDIPYFKCKENTLPMDDGAIVALICFRNGILLNDQVLSAICTHHGNASPLLVANRNIQISPLGVLIHISDYLSSGVQGGKSLR